MKRLNHIIYTLRHKYYFLVVEKKLTGKISWLGLTHDLDKLLMYIFFPISLKKISKIHRLNSYHHINSKIKSEKNYIQMVIDWECARFSKKDKPLNARNTLNKYYIEHSDVILPIIEKLKL
jgi:hypothetical protein